MSKSPYFGSLLAMVALATAAPCMADSMRCGNHLVVDGDTAGKLRSRCGEPASITRTRMLRSLPVWLNGRAVQLGYGAIEVQVETWEYNFGPRRFMLRVRIEDGLVVGIDTLGYGYP
jgi:hypothetical protein